MDSSISRRGKKGRGKEWSTGEETKLLMTITEVASNVGGILGPLEWDQICQEMSSDSKFCKNLSKDYLKDYSKSFINFKTAKII